MSVWKLLVSPFSCLYYIITTCRNYLYDNGTKKSFQFSIPLISVGNLTVGGTGKTPQVMYLIERLLESKRVGVLSRGYGRSSRGYVKASSNATARDIGDEPLQYKKRHGDLIDVVVCEERKLAIPQMLFENEELELIVLDDAYQHRAVKPALSILLSDYNRPFYEDYVMPGGLLRERRKGAKRCDILVISKCPKDITQKERAQIKEKCIPYLQKATPVLFSTVKSGKPVQVLGATYVGNHFFALSGIANPKQFEQIVADKFKLLGTKSYRDHYQFKEKDILDIVKEFERINTSSKAIITTEKDWMRLDTPEFRKYLKNIPLFYLPIDVTFTEGEEILETYLKKVVEEGVAK